MTATIDTLLALDDRLAAKGFPPLSEWWRAELGRFYRHATATMHAARVGRGGAKSTAIAKVALNEALFGAWQIPPGERHWALFVSENKDEAANRLRLVAAYLSALGIAHNMSGPAIELTAPGPLSRRGFRTSACRIGGVKGWRAFCLGEDEVAAWGATDEGADPPGEVHASAVAMTVTHPRARRLLYSSPLGTDDLHYEAVERGEGDEQIVSVAPSWVANPAIPEEQTRRLERDEKKWKREYMALPQSTVSAAFEDEAGVAAAFRPLPRVRSMGTPIGVVDMSGGRGDSAAWAVIRYATADVGDGFLFASAEGHLSAVHDAEHSIVAQDADGHRLRDPDWTGRAPPMLFMESVDSLDGVFSADTPGDVLVARIAEVFQRAGVRVVVGDSFGALFVETLFRAHGLRFVSVALTNGNKAEAVAHLRRLLRERAIILPPDAELRRQFGSYAEKITSSGAVRYEARGRQHDDRIALLVTHIAYELNGGRVVDRQDPSPVPGSPLGGGGRTSSRIDS